MVCRSSLACSHIVAAVCRSVCGLISCGRSTFARRAILLNARQKLCGSHGVPVRDGNTRSWFRQTGPSRKRFLFCSPMPSEHPNGLRGELNGAACVARLHLRQNDAPSGKMASRSSNGELTGVQIDVRRRDSGRRGRLPADRVRNWQSEAGSQCRPGRCEHPVAWGVVGSAARELEWPGQVTNPATLIRGRLGAPPTTESGPKTLVRQGSEGSSTSNSPASV